MTNQEILQKYYSEDTKEIIGEMYGRRKAQCTRFPPEYIPIEKKKLILTVNKDAFIFVWGWPGPDSNTYEFKDYGLTWAFSREEIIDEL